MEDRIDNLEKHFVLSGYGFFARFVHLPSNPTKGPQIEGKKEVGHD